MSLLPKVKLKALVSFPASVKDGVGTDVIKVNGHYQINLAFDDFAPPVAGIADAAHQNALLWNSLTGTYALAPVNLLGTGGAVPEAPNDGIQYGRQSLSWTPIAAGGDVVGPAGAVNDRVAVYNGATGKLIKDGGQTLAQLTAYTPSGGIAANTLAGAIAELDAEKAPLASPSFTGDPKAPTPSAGDSDTSIATTAFVTGAVSAAVGALPAPPSPSGANPIMDGVAAPGVAAAYSRGDHVHPTDTSRAPVSHTHPASQITDFSEAVDDRVAALLVAGTNMVLDYDDTANTLTITSTASGGGGGGTGDVVGPPSAVADRIAVYNGTTGKLIKDGGSTIAALLAYAPSGGISATTIAGAIAELDTEKAPLASPVFTGDPKAPTPTAGDNDTSIATTAFVTTAIAAIPAPPAAVPPATVAPLMDGVAAVGTTTKYAREDHVHPSDTSRAATVHTHAIADVTGLQPALDGKVNDTGDTMTGDLTISKIDPYLILNKLLSGQVTGIISKLLGLNRWQLALGDNIAEGGANSGSHFQLLRYNDAGALIDTPFSISRTTGIANFGQTPTSAASPPIGDDSTKVPNTAWVNHAARLINFKNTNYTFILSDAGGIVTCYANGAIAFTIPLNATVAFPVGTQIDMLLHDNGPLTISPIGGVTLISEDNKRRLIKNGSTGTLVKLATDTWVLAGSLAA